MGEDLGLSAKIAIMMIILLSILSVIISLNTMAFTMGRYYNNTISNSVNPKYEEDIRAMALLAEPIPVPSIYVALDRYGFNNLAQFDLSVAGIASTSPDNLTKNFGKQLYVKLVEAPDGLHVWVGDYY